MSKPPALYPANPAALALDDPVVARLLELGYTLLPWKKQKTIEAFGDATDEITVDAWKIEAELVLIRNIHIEQRYTDNTTSTTVPTNVTLPNAPNRMLESSEQVTGLPFDWKLSTTWNGGVDLIDAWTPASQLEGPLYTRLEFRPGILLRQASLALKVKPLETKGGSDVVEAFATADGLRAIRASEPIQLG